MKRKYKNNTHYKIEVITLYRTPMEHCSTNQDLCIHWIGVELEQMVITEPSPFPDHTILVYKVKAFLLKPNDGKPNQPNTFHHQKTTSPDGSQQQPCIGFIDDYCDQYCKCIAWEINGRAYFHNRARYTLPLFYHLYEILTNT